MISFDYVTEVPAKYDKAVARGLLVTMMYVTNSRCILCFAAFVVMGCTSQTKNPGLETIRNQKDLERVLSWLPTDTETLQVANGPLWMSNFAGEKHNYTDHEVKAEELEKQFQGLTLGLFSFGNGLLEKHLEGQKVSFALEASRHFRSPASLGELPFEGCALAIFEKDLEDRRNAFMKAAPRIEEIEAQKVAVFEEKQEQDTWTFFITFPEKNMALVSTNRQFLQQMLVRIHGTEGQRALPTSLHEWTFVDKQTPFWGLRHYDRQQAKYDPTSPFEGKKSANFPDEGAIGLTYQCDPKTRRATVTYLTAAGADTRKIAAERFPDAGEPAQLAGLHIQYQELGPGVIQNTFDLNRSVPMDLFFFIFMAHLGHAIYI